MKTSPPTFLLAIPVAAAILAAVVLPDRALVVLFVILAAISILGFCSMATLGRLFPRTDPAGIAAILIVYMVITALVGMAVILRSHFKPMLQTGGVDGSRNV